MLSNIALALFDANMPLSAMFQQQPVQTAYFYYYLVLFICLVVSSALGYKEIRKALSGISRSYYKYLILIIAVFLFMELAFVAPTHLLYNDEYIYLSVTKMMLSQHLAAVCSFSNASTCVPGTAGFIHQPLGWSFLLAIPSSVFGVNFSVAYNMELLFSVLSIAFLFFAVYILLRDQRVAVLSSAILAFTPLFMSYSRSSLLDTPAVTLLLLSIFLIAAYMKRKSTIVGISAAFAVAYMLSIKVDMIFALAIILLLLLLDRDRFEGKSARKDLKRFMVIVAIAILVILPALLYIYAASEVSFGAAPGQPDFSFSYLENYSTGNLLFWFGADDVVKAVPFNYCYFSEFPLTYTLLAIVGAFFLLKHKKYREFLLLLLWFIVVFIFYSSYYAGGVNYGSGDDVRYFTSAFPVIAILAAYGFITIFNFLDARLRARNRVKTLVPRSSRNYALITVMLVILFAESAFMFVTIVMMPPSHIYPFAAERYDENFIMQNYQKIPSNCFVLTFKPPLWYILGRGNIYASWANLSEYNSELMNMSKGCLYFDYSISCYINFTGPPNTAQQCLDIVRTYKMQPIASTELNNYSWNASFYLYKITGLNTT
ncbi:MAG: ArnT family glycosyltransferase [Candidatus Micrarchaeia archaeon]